MDIKAKPKLDLVFKNLFGDAENSDLLIDFLSSVLDIPTEKIINVTIIDNEIVPDVLNKKFSRLDLLLQTSEGYINIEIQVNNYGDFKERAIFYWSKIFSKQLNKGNEYSALQPTITINIVDFKLFDCEEPHSTFKLLETKRHSELSDKLRIDFLELPKAKKCKDETKLQEWLKFLNVTTEEGLDMMEKSTVNPTIIKKAVAVVRRMSADERLLFEIEKREEALMEERHALNFAEREGIAKGEKIGIQKERTNIILKLKSKGYTDEQIQDLLS